MWRDLQDEPDTDGGGDGTEKEPTTRDGSEIIQETLRLYGSIYLFCFLLFAVLRTKYPKLYNVRSWSTFQYTMLAEKKYSHISWFWEVFQVPDTDIHEQCGMDAVCFLRALRFGRKLCIVGCINAIWLIPTYYTSPHTGNVDDFFDKISIANLPSESKRFIATVFGSYIIFLYTMYLIIKEYKWYTGHRHKFLTEKRPRNYAVYVSGIPQAYQSSRQLFTYFSQCTKDSVVEAHVIRDTPKLDKLVSRRKLLEQKLEHAQALERKTGSKQSMIRLRSSGRFEKVETVECIRKELRDVTRNIVNSVVKISGSNRASRQFDRHQSTLNLLKAIQEDQLDDENSTIVSNTARDRARSRTSSYSNADTVMRRAALGGAADEESGPRIMISGGGGAESDDDGTLEVINEDVLETGSVLHVVGEDGSILQVVDENGNSIHVDENENFLETHKEQLEQGERRGSLLYITPLRKSLVSGTNAVVGSFNKTGAFLAYGSRAAGTTLVRTSRAAGSTIAMTGKVAGAQAERIVQLSKQQGVETFKMAQTLGTTVVTSAGAVVPQLLNKSEGSAREAGFVVFNSLYATQMALQMLHHPKPYTMAVHLAPDPKDIFWRNVGLPHHSKRSGTLAAIAASSVLCFFWSVPSAFVSSLTEIGSLKRELPELGEWIEDHPASEIIFAQLAPMILLFLNDVILPAVLKYIAQWEGHISAAMLEPSLFNKLGCFMIIQTFFVQAISGGVTAQLSDILENPESIVDLLATSLAAQSSYFIQIALAMTFFLQSMEMLRIYPLFVALLRRFIGPRVTAKERSRPWGLLHPLEDPPEFWHAETFAQLILFYMIFFVYGSTAPIINVFLLVCFVSSESGYRYQFIHNYPRSFDTGGRLWKHFISFTHASMIIAQLTLIGLLSLQQSPYAGPAILPLLGITSLFIFFVNSQHSEVAEYLPTRDCILRDSENNAEFEMDLSFLENAYLQPSLQQRSLDPGFDRNMIDTEDDDIDGVGEDWTDRTGREQ